jgi:hypothetical protein
LGEQGDEGNSGRELLGSWSPADVMRTPLHQASPSWSGRGSPELSGTRWMASGETPEAQAASPELGGSSRSVPLMLWEAPGQSRGASGLLGPWNSSSGGSAAQCGPVRPRSANGPVGYRLASPGHSPDDPHAGSFVSRPWTTPPHSEITAEEDHDPLRHSAGSAICGVPSPAWGSQWQEGILATSRGASPSWDPDSGTADTSPWANGNLEAREATNPMHLTWQEVPKAVAPSWGTGRDDRNGDADCPPASRVGHPEASRSHGDPRDREPKGEEAVAPAASKGFASDSPSPGPIQDRTLAGHKRRGSASPGLSAGFLVSRRRTSPNPGV